MSNPSNGGARPLDLTRPASADARIELEEIPLHSTEWAKTVWPVALILLVLIASVMLVPFVIIVLTQSDKAETAVDWAKTVLPPVVGFGGALVGYYFGTRGTQKETSPEN